VAEPSKVGSSKYSAPTGSHAPFKLPKQKILFAAFRGWDAVGAKSFGYETYLG
jgi:hypothetical protein